MVYALESVVVGDLVYLAYSSPLDFSLPYPLLVLVEDRARVQKFDGVPSVQCLLFKFNYYLCPYDRYLCGFVPHTVRLHLHICERDSGAGSTEAFCGTQALY